MASTVAGAKRPAPGPANSCLSRSLKVRRVNSNEPGRSPTPPTIYQHGDIDIPLRRDHSVQRGMSSSPMPTSRPATPVRRIEPTPPPLSTPPKFLSDTSIVLIGIRGTGKSTLAVIAAAAFQMRLIDADEYFHRVTGFSRAAYTKEHGLIKYRSQESQILHSMLTENERGCVITCGPGTVEGAGQRLIRDYAKTHPVIHVIRDARSIANYLRVPEEKISRILNISGTLYRSLSNLEYYNLSQPQPLDLVGYDKDTVQRVSGGRSSPRTPFLRLKEVEQDFVSFLRCVLGDSWNLDMRILSSPLAGLPLAVRQYTYAMSILMSELEDETALDIEDCVGSSDAVELIIDTLPSSSNFGPAFLDSVSRQFSRLRRNINVPIILNYSPIMDQVQGYDNDSELSDILLAILHHGIRLKPDYITLNLSLDERIVQDVIDSVGSIKVIGQLVHTSPTARYWDLMNGKSGANADYNKAKDTGCDMVRIFTANLAPEDNFSAIQFSSRIRTMVEASSEGNPLLTGLTFGKRGRLSMCHSRTLTPVTHRGSGDKLSSYSTILDQMSMLTLAEGQEALFKSFVLDPLKFYVVGKAVQHSLSPAMQNAAFRSCGIPHIYQPRPSSSINELENLRNDQNWGGASVSLPFKTEVMSLLTAKSVHASIIGAANTLLPMRRLPGKDESPEYVLEEGRNHSGPVAGFYGENTDWIGIRACIQSGLSPINAVTDRTTGLIIGAGGMARAAAYSMIQLGIKNIFVYNRTFEHAEKLAEHYNAQYCKPKSHSGTDYTRSKSHTIPKISTIQSLTTLWPADHRRPTVIVSCIPSYVVDDQPPPDFRLPTNWLESPTGGVLVELDPKYLDTPLSRQLRSEHYRSRGWVTSDGLDLVPEQGFAQFELFTGRKAPKGLMRAEVLRNSYNNDRLNKVIER